MLLALDTTVPFLAVSAKKPTEQDKPDIKDLSLRDQKYQKKVTITYPKYQMIWQTGEYEYSLGSKPLSLKVPSVCRAITRQQKMEKGENRHLKAGIKRGGKSWCQKYTHNRPIASPPDRQSKSPAERCPDLSRSVKSCAQLLLHSQIQCLIWGTSTQRFL